MSRGIIMELKGSKAVVLTPTGEFKSTRLPAGKYELGQEVDVKGNYFYSIHRLSAAAAVLLLALLVPYILSIAVLDTNAYAYVDLDINPSVEFTINRQSRIIHARGLNGDGEKVLSDAELVGKSLGYGIEYFALRAIELGFAQGDGSDYILATTVFEGAEDEKLESRVARTLEKVMEKNGIAADTDTLVATKEIKWEADRAGVSSGKFLILLQAAEENVDIDIQDLKSKSAARAIKEAGADIKKIVQDVNKRGQDLGELLEKNKDRALNKVKNVPGRSDSRENLPVIPVDKRPGSKDNGKNNSARDKDAPEQRDTEKPGADRSHNRNNNSDDSGSDDRDDNRSDNGKRPKDKDNPREDREDDRKQGGNGKNEGDSIRPEENNGRNNPDPSERKPRDKAGPKGKAKTSGLAEDIIMQLFE